MKPMRILTAIMTMLMLGDAAHASDGQLVWYQCAMDSDCIVIPGACKGSWNAVNAQAKNEATAWTKKQSTLVECAASESDAAHPPQAECFATKCMIKKD